ncbi:MAG TPA: FUSC family protein [Aliidongia sp.]|nr:FUSC family protein [Aliidongia sp.]
MSAEATAARVLPRLLPSFGPKAWFHALSTFAAAMLALYVAFALELDSPGSAVVTVLIVSSPLPGMVLSKGLWRMVGTLVGLLISIALIARFAQSPLAFIGALSIWLGLCTYVSSLLRHFRAYAAVLAGYTISLVALPALDDPNRIFDIATARIAVVAVGILSTALVKSMLVLEVGERRLKPAIEGALAATTGFAVQALDLVPGLPDRRRAVADRLVALDPLILAAANESAATAQKAPAVRLLVSILIHTVTLASSVRDALASLPVDGVVAAAITPLRDQVRDLLSSLTNTAALLSPATAEALEAAHRTAIDLPTDMAVAIAPETLDILALTARLEDIVEQLQLARDLLRSIEEGRTGRSVTPVSYHRDQRAAVINGMRAALATLLAGCFWIATAWPSGTQMLAALAPVTTLLGASEYPEKASLSFSRGMTLAGICAVICDFGLLAHVDGFPLLALMIAPFLVACSLYGTIPKHASSSTAFLVFFPTFLNLQNPMRYDISVTLNTVFAFILGSFFGALAFRTLWPSNPVEAARRLIRQMCRDLRDLAAKHVEISQATWETIMLDRLARLGTRLSTSPERATVVEGGMAAIHVGREIMRARRMLAGLTLPEEVARSVEAARQALHALATSPDDAAQATQAAALRLLKTAGLVPETERTNLLRAAAAHHDMALLLARHRDFFRGALPAAKETL